MEYLIWYLAAINVLTFFVYGLDKHKARKGRWRIPEATLLMLAALGGSIGAYAGMKIFRHKTKKPKFYVAGIRRKNRNFMLECLPFWGCRLELWYMFAGDNPE